MAATVPPTAGPAPAGPATTPAMGRALRWSARLAMAAIAGLLLLSAVTTLDVLMRYGLAWPIRGFVEISSLAGAVLLAACMPYLLASRGNIAVDALGQALGPRVRRGLDSFGAAVTAAFFLVMAWQYAGFALELRHTAQAIPVLRWPSWPWWAAVTVFIAIAGGVGVWATVWRCDGEPA